MISFWHWHNEPLLVGSIVLYLWIYLVLIGPFRIKLGSFKYPVKCLLWQIVAVATFYIAIGSPLDALGENFLFSAHMLQHNMLMYLCPLFFILGIPTWLSDYLILKLGISRKLLKFLLHPLVSSLLFTLIFSIWHLPYLYEWALRSKPVHILEHLTMFAPSILVWWNVSTHSKLIPKLPPGARMLQMFFIMVGQTPVFACLAFSSDVLYKTYEYAPRVFDITPLEDQISGAVVMKLAGMIVALTVIGLSFREWANENN